MTTDERRIALVRRWIARGPSRAEVVAAFALVACLALAGCVASHGSGDDGLPSDPVAAATVCACDGLCGCPDAPSLHGGMLDHRGRSVWGCVCHPACTSDDDCSASLGAVCVTGFCGVLCETTADCPEGMGCLTAGEPPICGWPADGR